MAEEKRARNDAVLDAIHAGEKLAVIAFEHRISRQRVAQIAQARGASDLLAARRAPVGPVRAMCRYPACGRVFSFAAGRPRGYCTPECAVLARRESAIERGRQSYELALRTTKTWVQICTELGHTKVADTMRLAKRYARHHSLRWPLERARTRREAHTQRL